MKQTSIFARNFAAIYIFALLLFLALSNLVSLNVDFVLQKFRDEVSEAEWELLFLRFLPAVQFAGLTTTYACFFPNIEQQYLHISSKDRANRLLRGAVVASAVLSLCNTGIHEILIPGLQKKIATCRALTQDYYDYLDEAAKFINSGELASARLCVKNARLIEPDSGEAKMLEAKIAARDEKEEFPSVQANADTEDEGGVAQWIGEAQKMWAEGKYFEAHYFFTKAAETMPAGAQLDECNEMAKKSWDMLNRANFSLDDNSEEIFAKKREGYGDIVAKDFVSAYYIFLDLKKNLPFDNDIDKFLQQATEGLEKSFFFADEANSILSQEFAHDVFFSVRKNDGTVVVRIKWMMRLAGTAEICYLRTVDVIEYDGRHKVTKSFSVPMAKLLVVKGDIPDPYPTLLCCVLDRDENKIVSEPSFSIGDAAMRTYQFPITMDEMNILSAASAGPDAMTFLELLGFVRQENHYGYPFEVFAAKLCERLHKPLILFVWSLFAVIFACRFKIEKRRRMKFRWIFMLPILIALAHFFLQVAEYVNSLFIFALVGGTGILALTVFPVFLVVISILESVAFILSCKD